MKDLPGYLLGSISRTVLTHGPCSVLTVKSPLDIPASVLIALDGSKASNFAANRVKNWLSPEVVTLQLVSVVPDIMTDASQNLIPKSRLKALVAPLRLHAKKCLEQYRELFLKEGFQVTGKRLQGNPREQILEIDSSLSCAIGGHGIKGTHWCGTVYHGKCVGMGECVCALVRFGSPPLKNSYRGWMLCPSSW